MGGTPLSETYTITNSGTAPLTLGQVSISGTNASDFTVTSQPASSVAAGGSTTFTIQFAPTAVGTSNATVSFTENDTSTTSPFTFAISGVANNNTGSLSGTAYDDMLGTGSLASSDPVLANIKITLTGTDSSSTAVNQTATTSTSGTYTFSNLVAGTYTLTATLPTFLSVGRATAGNEGGTPSGESIGSITLPAGAAGTGYNFSTSGLTAEFLSVNLFLASTPAASQVLNPGPTISAIANQSVAEDASTSAVSFTVADAFAPASALSVSGSSSNTTLVPTANIVYGGSGADRTVTVTPASGQTGTATITTTVTDPYGDVSDVAFTLSVTAQSASQSAVPAVVQNSVSQAPASGSPAGSGSTSATDSVFSQVGGSGSSSGQSSAIDAALAGENNWT